MMMQKSFLSVTDRSQNLVIISASALGLYVFTTVVSTFMQTKLLTESSSKPYLDSEHEHEHEHEHESSTKEQNSIEYHIKNTERNRRVLQGAYNLLEKPWGFQNCHIASLLAAMRPSPFLLGGDRAVLVRRTVSQS